MAWDSVSPAFNCSLYIDGIAAASNASVLNNTVTTFTADLEYGDHAWNITCADIVNNTKVKLGEQVSGIAVKENRSFLLDDKVSDNRIKRYLKRPQISSSMVIPLKIENRVVGVMNIGALNTSIVRFFPNNLKLMSRLLDLAALAIHS